MHVLVLSDQSHSRIFKCFFIYIPLSSVSDAAAKSM